MFTFTTDIPVDSVRMVDELGNPVFGQAVSVDPQKTVWTLTVIFDEPVIGTFRGEMLLKEVWYEGEKTIDFIIATPTPEPTLEPSPSPEISGSLFGATEDSMDGLNAASLSMPGENDFIVDEQADPFESLQNDLAPAVVTPTQAPRATMIPTAVPTAVPTLVPTIVPTTVPTAVPTATVLVAQATLAPSAEPFVVLRNTATPVPALAVAEQPGEVDPSSDDIPAWDETGVEDAAPGDDTEPGDMTADNLPVNEWDDIDPAALAAAAALAAQDTQTEPAAAGTATAAQPLLPMMPDEEALPSVLKLKEDVYQKGKKVKELDRTNPINLPMPQQYASYEGGVFAFRNDGFRGNAAFGKAEMPLEQLSVLWKAPLGSLRVDGDTLYGLGYTGQPAIVKWSVELRQMMKINEDKKDVKALKEVIAASQDGKVYFFDLNDGEPTREPIDIGYPLKSSIAVDTMGRPMLSFGQGISKMPGGKTGPIGFYLYNLIDQKQLQFINGRKTKIQTQYSTSGAFDSSALFDRESDSMIVVGENGLLYTVALNTVFDYLDKMTIAVDPVITYNKSKAAAQPDMSVTAEASVAMYGKYAYIADRHGILKAIDTDSMLTQWAFDTGDNTDATPALGFDEDRSLGLYTGTTVFTRSKKAGEAVIRRIDALSGKEIWKHAVTAKYEPYEQGGVKASPVVGEYAISELVIFTVNLTGEGKSATVMALNKKTGDEVWSFELGSPSVSSPVAVYRENGDAFLVQADEKGVLYLLNAATGELLNTLDLEGSLAASPAVYNDVLVIGTNGKDNSYLYGIRLE
ncbi:MAG: PQQ-binding-like beta-propeller repeat protein [Clostridiales bacterium]|nr:PQQ-binding-like beta-propeller repeat protein [Clostridiales bacterium]